MRLATWNVNSVRARLPLVLDWLAEATPDIVLFQELKCETSAFPTAALAAAGYAGLVVGQKSYNGVALLARAPLTVTPVCDHLPGDATDEQARYVEGEVAGLRVASLYVPNGNPVDSAKYPYKLAWMARLRTRAQALLTEGVPLILGGDFNVIPAAEDVYDPQGWAEDALFRLDTRRSYRALLNLGLTDAFRALHPQARAAYSFWDYQGGAWPRNQGLRIDHFLIAPAVVDRLDACTIDRAPRARDKASDHTPVVLEVRST